MRTYLAWLLAAVALPLTAYAQEATIKEVHDKPAVHGSIIANLLQEHDNPFTLYPYDTNYVIYTQTSDLNKEAISSYNWSDNARKDEVKFQLSLAFPFWRGILGPNSVLGASYTQKSWWQLSNSGNPRRSVKPTMSRSCSSALQRIMSLPAGRCVTSKWALTTIPTAVPTRLPVAGTVPIRA
jgi:outer membrane phospholipase A